MKNAFVMGMLAMLVVLGALGYLFLEKGMMPTHADEPPSALERWAARKSLHATVEREAPKTPPPVAADSPNLLAGLALYKTNCLVCHGASNGTASNVASGLYQKPPQFALHGVTDDPEGKIYWFIKHGVRLTGMPSFTVSLSEKEMWQVAVLLKHLDSLPPDVEKAWKALPAAGN